METADVRVLLQMVVYLDHVITQDGVIRKETWDKQLGDEEKAALQRLIDEVHV